MNHNTKWRLLAPAGLATIGFGLSVLGDAIERKTKGNTWFWRGTLGLSLINAGISVFGDAVKERALYEWETLKH
jgi:hypothetical protein